MNNGETQQQSFDRTFTISLFSVAKKNKRSFVEVAEAAQVLAREGLNSVQILERLKATFSQRD